MGTVHHQLWGNILFEDEKNGLTGYLNIGDFSRKPRDYFQGRIEHKSNGVVC